MHSKLLVYCPKWSSSLLKCTRSCCNKPLCEPTWRPTIVALVGGNSRVGQLTGLLLKQCNLINELRIFDYQKGPDGVSLDLGHIDTNVKLTSFTGLDTLRNAITEANVVVICGGETSKPTVNEYELFMENADYVRNIALHTAEFNPQAILCITTPPVTAMVPLASEEYKKAGTYNAKKIIGVTTIGTIRANSIIGNYAEKDPYSVKCPLVGGLGSTTLVPVLSQTEIGAKLPKPAIELLHNQICKAEDEALYMKFIENSGPCINSSAYATSRFVTSVLRGLTDTFYGYECGFVRQVGHIESFLSYMTSVIKLGRQGVHSIHMPYLNDFETSKLEKAAIIIRKQIKWGESYITGESMERKRRTKRPLHNCEVIKIDHQTRIGDVNINK